MPINTVVWWSRKHSKTNFLSTDSWQLWYCTHESIDTSGREGHHEYINRGKLSNFSKGTWSEPSIQVFFHGTNLLIVTDGSSSNPYSVYPHMSVRSMTAQLTLEGIWERGKKSWTSEARNVEWGLRWEHHLRRSAIWLTWFDKLGWTGGVNVQQICWVYSFMRFHHHQRSRSALEQQLSQQLSCLIRHVVPSEASVWLLRLENHVVPEFCRAYCSWACLLCELTTLCTLRKQVTPLILAFLCLTQPGFVHSWPRPWALQGELSSRVKRWEQRKAVF